MHSNIMMYARWKSLGPIVISAFSVFITFLILQPLALLLDPAWTLLSSRSIGKITLTVIVIEHILLLIFLQSRQFLQQWFQTNLRFLESLRWLKSFFLFFLTFFCLHSLILLSFYCAGYLIYDPAWGIIKPSLVLRTAFGFVVTFFLAWTEELIFRGTVYPLLVQHLSKLESVFLASLIFMLCHDLTNPLNLMTKDWKLGLGLFLLGMMLNLIFVVTGKLYSGMGAHAGLVFVKVILRRARFLVFLPAAQLPLWVNEDLRQSTLIHALFAIVNLSLIIMHRKKLFSNNKIGE